MPSWAGYLDKRPRQSEAEIDDARTRILLQNGRLRPILASSTPVIKGIAARMHDQDPYIDGHGAKDGTKPRRATPAMQPAQADKADTKAGTAQIGASDAKIEARPGAVDYLYARRLDARMESPDRGQHNGRRRTRPLFGEPADNPRGAHHTTATRYQDVALAANAAPSVPTIFIECTHTYHSDLNTGIQRVVRNVTRHASAVAADLGYAVVPVILDGRALVPADIARVQDDKLRSIAQAPTDPSTAANDVPMLAESARPGLRNHLVDSGRSLWRLGLRLIATLLPFDPVREFVYAPPYQRGLARSLLAALRLVGIRAASLNSSPPANMDQPSLDRRTDCTGDILLLLDSSWGVPIWPPVERFKRRGGQVVGVIYDLIPVTHSYTCVPELVSAFRAWLHNHACVTDGFVAISRSTAKEVSRYFSTHEPPRHDIPVGYFHLGSELDFMVAGDTVRKTVTDIFDREQHIFVAVGSIEPRKNHAFILDAFDRTWAAGGEAVLVLIGRYGWKSDAFLDRVAAHPAFGRQLYLLRDATDTELDYAYRNASALVTASEIEGFGLPVVEALQRGLPVLCSDIPVFREIADGNATFFQIDDPKHLAAALNEFCRARRPADRQYRAARPWLSWRESTEQLLAAVMDVVKRAGSAKPMVMGDARSHQG
jgi:O-antigen biosynthesis alpha-1,2-rhamnosyltransferase